MKLAILLITALFASASTDKEATTANEKLLRGAALASDSPENEQKIWDGIPNFLLTQPYCDEDVFGTSREDEWCNCYK